MEDKDFDKANEYFDRILDIDPEQAKVYMGKVLAAQRVCNEEQLITCGSEIKDSADYEKAVRFARGEEKKRYEELPDRINRQRENAEKEKQYQAIIRDKKWAPGAQHMRRIAIRFRELGDYKDSLSQAEECEKLAVERDRIELERTRKEKLAEQERIRVEQEKLEVFKARGVCQHCGGSFRGLFNKVCRTCGKPKDY